jgi:putative Mg2+ transporter-C (MgtC) family protein
MLYPFNLNEGQQWPQICQLLLAVGLSSAIGAERQLRHKSAGLRTNTLVGMGSALFMLMSKFGFSDVLSHYLIVLDPSRIAAQIVSGIGFVGGGIIFKQQNEVRGLTTAAAVWLSAAVGAACGAGLPILASITTGLYFLTVLIYPFLWHALEWRFHRPANREVCIMIRYRNIDGGLQSLLEAVLKAGFEVRDVKRLEEVLLERTQSHLSASEVRSSIHRSEIGSPQVQPLREPGEYSRIFDVHLTVQGQNSSSELACILSQLNCVIAVSVAQDATDEV